MLPETVEALGALGVPLPDAADSHPLRGIRFRGEEATVDASFPRGEGLGVRRTILHQLLIDRAAAVGVEMRWGVRIGALEEIRARWIIGADGQGSRVRCWAGLDECVRESRRYGFRRHYRAVPWTDRVEVHWARQCQMYVTPVSPNEVCLALLSRDPHIRMADAETEFPRLMARLGGASQGTNERGAVSAMRQLRRVWRGNVALAGDASGSVDAITGEGMCLAFRQAPRLAEALESENLDSYQRWHKRAMGRPAFMADLLLLLDRFPGLREPALRALESWPGLFDRLVAFHTSGETLA
jgi:flavin-dependent dehydrogenase